MHDKTILAILTESATLLGNAGVSDPRREASSILAHAIGRDRTFLIAHPEYSLSGEELLRFEPLLARRAAREPLQYILGRTEFYGLEFEVSPGVLIPRPETELIVEAASRFLNERAEPGFCEVGVGSGCISAAILKQIPAAVGIGLEISPDALAVARRNIEAHHLTRRFELRRSDVFSALGDDEMFDAIVSNPPYIAVGEIAGLQPEVRNFEPHRALTDGGDGLSLIRAIIFGAPRFLRSGGLLLVEIGFGQSMEVASMIDRSIWSEPEFLKDLQGIERTLSVVRRSRG